MDRDVNDYLQVWLKVKALPMSAAVLSVKANACPPLENRSLDGCHARYTL